jgi:hypothetical protein
MHWEKHVAMTTQSADISHAVYSEQQLSAAHCPCPWSVKNDCAAGHDPDPDEPPPSGPPSVDDSFPESLGAPPLLVPEPVDVPVSRPPSVEWEAATVPVDDEHPAPMAPAVAAATTNQRNQEACFMNLPPVREEANERMDATQASPPVP